MVVLRGRDVHKGMSTCVCVSLCVMVCVAHLGMAGTRVPFSSMKCPPALSTQRWCSDMRACRAVVGVSFPSWLSAFFSGENSSSLSTSNTTNFLSKHKCRWGVSVNAVRTTMLASGPQLADVVWRLELQARRINGLSAFLIKPAL